MDFVMSQQEGCVFELYCQFGPDYPFKPPLVHFVTTVYHCNVNSVGRICHNLFDCNYNTHITMREILDAVYGLRIIPEPEDPLDSILAEEFLTCRETYDREAEKHRRNLILTLVKAVPQFIPQHLICPLTKKMFVDPVKMVYGTVYERMAIEEHLKLHQYDLTAGPGNEFEMSDIRADQDMKKMVMDHRSHQIRF
ncbi:ubiquitin-conjugating enzyme E2 D2-like [Eleginops maclovinus]|uniref:ubiquitin-conjugating enzyme E2 D2-like n=1 Tax=Eleginops maclovinus TaxID=56733 RepID=UPI0030806FC4